jgi:hypothetical protein
MKWQYEIVHSKDPAELQGRLNQAGAYGWEAVSLVLQEGADPDRLMVLLERPMPKVGTP